MDLPADEISLCRRRSGTTQKNTQVQHMPYVRIYHNGVLKDQVQLTANRVTIGRAARNDIVIDDPGVSACHAILERDAGGFVIQDNRSTNGVFVNGERVDRRVLRYWDEIQIFNHVVKFMALARLDQEEHSGPPSLQPDLGATMEVDVSSIDDLIMLRRQRKQAYVVWEQGSEPGTKHLLTKVNFCIGKGKGCDIPIYRWFGPKVAASIQRQNDGFYLIPGRWGGVDINGAKLSAAVKLKDGDSLRVRGCTFAFYNRICDEP